MDALEKLFYLAGVAQQYHDYAGENRVIPREVREKCLRAMHFDTQSPAAVEKAIHELDARPWTELLGKLEVIEASTPGFVLLRVPDALCNYPLQWQMTCEDGARLQGDAMPGSLAEDGEYYIGQSRFVALRLPLPALPPGYHNFQAQLADLKAETVLAACPAKCFSAEGDEQGKYWGAACQLYTLRSATNWGMGDFRDLRELLELGSASGMDFLLLNPLHAPDFAGEDFASPYSASDRRFLNPLYIDVPGAAGQLQLTRVQALLDETSASDAVGRLRALTHIDYSAVARLKFETLWQLYEAFRVQHLANNSPAARELEVFKAQGGDELAGFAAHAAANTLAGLACKGDVGFQVFLQWLCRQQLQECQLLARSSGMRIGLVGDLAVGAAAGGAEVCGNTELFSTGASIGAPPDPLNEQGQDWALPAPIPYVLRKSGFAHFANLLRNNMQSSGALRIDHVMGLMRLWWCLPQSGGGAYVYYPFEEMFALLRLESARQRCRVIGEDMGVVEDVCRHAMQASGLLNNRLFYFEREHDGRFRDPRQHSHDTLYMVSNHDVPTLAAWWNREDLHLKQRLGIFGDDSGRVLADELSRRATSNRQVLEWLERGGLLPASRSPVDDAACAMPFDMALCESILTSCARSSARLMSIQLEDLQLMREPVNVPGTYREYPNWRRKQAKTTAEIFADSRVQALLGAIDQERKTWSK